MNDVLRIAHLRIAHQGAILTFAFSFTPNMRKIERSKPIRNMYFSLYSNVHNQIQNNR